MMLYTLKEAAEILKTTAGYIRVKIRRGQVEAKKYGHTWLLTEDELNRLKGAKS